MPLHMQVVFKDKRENKASALHHIIIENGAFHAGTLLKDPFSISSRNHMNFPGIE